MASLTQFTSETAKAALTDILAALNSPDNVQKITEAKENSGNEMLKMMQFVFPIVTQIQMDVIKNYGFPEGREGTVQFAQFIRTLERDDPEIAQLHGQVRAYFLPPVTISSSTEASL
ncbi:protein C10 [Neodiprion pinetum]|uniref:Protein C10 n=1 Tax=Neodiprion lecontei TaxID=441921 RepID=A0A6J0C6N1_NEOLC|nr:protein C10 isoform X1 [Neodiprion lecontei]XP_046427333.1 protein C10 isoform X1 [Neodiprion fabricii]XP_046483974.1 protein C10 isoform X1 [Neodiprion pinetum]XP_046483975.1 protein C10 isoform X1 [Neodiprion pinetum]XP_046597133.1 protein C10 isoform X1 [Neodiprion lecontei]XP_046621310.1 protein C10 isoform X1 [Neodiprion virginianus]